MLRIIKKISEVIIGFLPITFLILLLYFLVSIVPKYFDILKFIDSVIFIISFIILPIINCIVIRYVLFFVKVNDDNKITIRLKSKKEIAEAELTPIYLIFGALLMIINHNSQFDLYSGTHSSLITQLIIIKNLFVFVFYLVIFMICTKRQGITNELVGIISDRLIIRIVVLIFGFFYLKGVAKYEFGQKELGAFLEQDNYDAQYLVHAVDLSHGQIYNNIFSEIEVSQVSHTESQEVWDTFDGRSPSSHYENVVVYDKVIILKKLMLPNKDTLAFPLDTKIELQKVVLCEDYNGNKWQVYLQNKKIKVQK